MKSPEKQATSYILFLALLSDYCLIAVEEFEAFQPYRYGRRLTITLRRSYYFLQSFPEFVYPALFLSLNQHSCLIAVEEFEDFSRIGTADA